LETGGAQLLSFDTTVELPGAGGTTLVAGPADVVRFDGAVYSLAFDSTAAGLPAGLNVDAATRLGNDVAVSFDTTVALTGRGQRLAVAGPVDLPPSSGGVFTEVIDWAAANPPDGKAPDGLNLVGASYFEESGRRFVFAAFDRAAEIGGVLFTKSQV